MIIREKNSHYTRDMMGWAYFTVSNQVVPILMKIKMREKMEEQVKEC